MTETLYKIPLIAEPQTFDIEVGGTSYIVTTKWNGELPAWELTAKYTETGETLFDALPLVTGVDLMAQYKHLGIDGTLFCTTFGDEDAPPTLENLGIQSFLYYLV